MSFYDQKVAEELGLQFVSVKMQDTAAYRKYHKILLTQYPDQVEMGWTTYLICDSPEGEFKILGEVKGGHPKGEFHTKLQDVLNQVAANSMNRTYAFPYGTRGLQRFADG